MNDGGLAPWPPISDRVGEPPPTSEVVGGFNGPGLASVILGGAGIAAAVPVVVATGLFVALVGFGVEFVDATQIAVVKGVLSSLILIPVVGALTLCGVATAVVGLARPARALATTGLSLAFVNLVVVIAASTVLALFVSALVTAEPLRY